MKNQDLRIGNYVNYIGNDVLVTGIDQEYVYVNAITFDYLTIKDIEPILLTEYWMPILGFKQDPELPYRWKIPNKEITYDLDDNCMQIGGSWDWKKIKYVHEMQNLIYELIKKEI